jgi:hypothetical protein
MNPHKLIIHLCLCVIVVFVSTKISFPKQPVGGRLAIVVDERLSVLRAEPQLTGRIVKRLSRGRLVAIRGSRTTSDGVIFYLVNVTNRTHGWIQREAVVSAKHRGDDRRLVELINLSHGFDRIIRARLFLDHFPRSPLRPHVLLLLGSTAEEQAAKLSRDAAKRLNGTRGDAPEFTFFLNYSGLDRYNRQRVGFIFNQSTKRFHYDGAAWRELARRHPNSPDAVEARKRLAQLSELK